MIGRTDGAGGGAWSELDQPPIGNVIRRPAAIRLKTSAVGAVGFERRNRRHRKKRKRVRSDCLFLFFGFGVLNVRRVLQDGRHEL